MAGQGGGGGGSRGVSGHTPAPAAGADCAALGLPPCCTERALLLGFKAGITNWAAVSKSRGLIGWGPCRNVDNCDPVCNWGGVACDPNVANGNSVTML